jgi:hypothetical protein
MSLAIETCIFFPCAREKEIDSPVHPAARGSLANVDDAHNV